MKRISPNEAEIVTGKLNELLQSSYVNLTTFTIDDVVNTGLTLQWAKRVMREIMQEKKVFFFKGKYSAHPKAFIEIEKGQTEAKQ